jgi:hypothetical protein
MTVTRLQEVISYNPATGEFWWRIARGNARAGEAAGCLDCYGYRKIRVYGYLYLASHLAFLYMTGCWPPQEIDHRNRDPGDDSWSNIRPATRSQNLANRKLTKPSGLPRGVFFARAGQFQAEIRRDSRKVHLGTFPTAEAASDAYRKAAADTFGEFAFQEDCK